LSRCQRHEFRRVAVDEIVANLKEIVRQEQIQADDDALTLIARQSTGGVRDAQSLLDQLVSSGDRVTLALAQTVLGTATSQTVLDLFAAILDREPARGLETIHRALDSGADPRALARQLVEYLRGLMLIQMGNADQVETTAEVRKQMETHAGLLAAPEVLRCMRIFNAAASELRASWQPSLALELALAEVLEGQAAETAPQPPPAPAAAQTGKSGARGAAGPAADRGHADAAEAPVIGAGEVIRAWKQVIAAVPRSQANLAALLNSVKAIDVQGGTLILGFASEVLVSKMDKPELIEFTRQAVQNGLGVVVSIRCGVTNARGKIPRDVAQDGMVAAAIQQGGEIVDVQE
jgi:DNA polymerase-3 subunit gamma/tau